MIIYDILYNMSYLCIFYLHARRLLARQEAQRIPGTQGGDDARLRARHEVVCLLERGVILHIEHVLLFLLHLPKHHLQ